MAALQTPNILVPVAPSGLWNSRPKSKEDNENDDYREERLNQQSEVDEDASGEDQHDPSEENGIQGSRRAVGISHPHVNDVLCGRGGLTNNHPGNEWFRKLVRSNRPLYHACPKHTKLLVSKAIVQAVQAQDPPGRFLERNKKDKLWYPVGYKKAVDKTSQGLREKERGDEVYQAPLPAMLANRGSKAPTNLQDLAKVTMARAGLDPILPSQSHTKRQPPPNRECVDANPPNKKAKTNAGAKSFTKSPPMPTTPTLQEWDDPLPLPTQPLQTRQSSMFRFLSQTVLLKDAVSSTANASGPATTPPAMLKTPSTSFMSAPAVAAAFAAAQSSNKQSAAPSPWFYGTTMPPPAAGAGSSVAAPVDSTVLTRFTSQVSDIFATFWSQPSGNTSNYQQQPQQHQKKENTQRIADTAATMITFATAPEATSLVMDGHVTDGDEESVMPTTLSFSKSASSLPTICNDDCMREHSDVLDDDDDNIKAVVAPPSELERSVSATLLKFASTAFLRDITGIFQRSATTIEEENSRSRREHINSYKDEEEVEQVCPKPPSPLPFDRIPPTTMTAASVESKASSASQLSSLSPWLVTAKINRTSLLDDD